MARAHDPIPRLSLKTSEPSSQARRASARYTSAAPSRPRPSRQVPWRRRNGAKVRGRYLGPVQPNNGEVGSAALMLGESEICPDDVCLEMIDCTGS